MRSKATDDVGDGAGHRGVEERTRALGSLLPQGLVVLVDLDADVRDAVARRPGLQVTDQLALGLPSLRRAPVADEYRKIKQPQVEALIVSLSGDRVPEVEEDAD